jgi:hypothetical protein
VDSFAPLHIACDNRYMIRTLLLAVASFLALHAQDNPFSDDARQAYGIVKVSVLKAAERMPAADYSFRTTPKVRTFAEMIDHVTQAQMLMCGVVKGEKSITNPRFKPAPTTKADLVAALKASFDYCDPVYASMTDAAGTAKVKWFIGDMSRLGLLNWNISHDNEMYGIIGAFLRIKGLVPPSSEGRPPAAK